MEVGMGVCRVGPVARGRGGCSGIRLMANFVLVRIFVWRAYVYCSSLVCVVFCAKAVSRNNKVRTCGPETAIALSSSRTNRKMAVLKVLTFGCVMKPAHVNSVYVFHGWLNRFKMSESNGQ